MRHWIATAATEKAKVIKKGKDVQLDE
jgi:hypothetical protein